MDTIWFGIKVGIVIGMALIRFVWREITGPGIHETRLHLSTRRR